MTDREVLEAGIKFAISELYEVQRSVDYLKTLGPVGAASENIQAAINNLRGGLALSKGTP